MYMQTYIHIWKAVVDVPCDLQRVVIILQRVVGYAVRPQWPSIYIESETYWKVRASLQNIIIIIIIIIKYIYIAQNRVMQLMR